MDKNEIELTMTNGQWNLNTRKLKALKSKSYKLTFFSMRLASNYSLITKAAFFVSKYVLNYVHVRENCIQKYTYLFQVNYFFCFQINSTVFPLLFRRHDIILTIIYASEDPHTRIISFSTSTKISRVQKRLYTHVIE